LCHKVASPAVFSAQIWHPSASWSPWHVLAFNLVSKVKRVETWFCKFNRQSRTFSNLHTMLFLQQSICYECDSHWASCFETDRLNLSCAHIISAHAMQEAAEAAMTNSIKAVQHNDCDSGLKSCQWSDEALKSWAVCEHFIERATHFRLFVFE
jgi:hypothetical protein